MKDLPQLLKFGPDQGTKYAENPSNHHGGMHENGQMDGPTDRSGLSLYIFPDSAIVVRGTIRGINATFFCTEQRYILHASSRYCGRSMYMHQQPMVPYYGTEHKENLAIMEEYVMMDRRTEPIPPQ